MTCQALSAEACFAEIKRLEKQHEAGAVANIAEKMWAGCSYDNAYNESVRAEYDMPIFNSDYRENMTDVVFVGDLSVCVIQHANEWIGDKLLEVVARYLQNKDIPVYAIKGDLLYADYAEHRAYKVGSYGSMDVGGMWETTVHISINADMDIITRFCGKPPQWTRKGLGEYGVTAAELLNVISEVIA